MAPPNPIPSPPEESDRPFPPRFWWLKRGAALFVLMLAALSVLRWWWGREADRRLRAEIAAAQSRGEPVLPGDFQTPECNADTADKALSVAANRFVEIKQSGWLASHDQLPLSDRALKEIATAVAANQESLGALRRARSLPVVSWGAPPGGEVLPRLPHEVSTHLNSLARLMRWKALSAHQAGNDREAAELILDLLHQERVLDHGPPTLIAHLLALAIQSRAMDCIRAIDQSLVVTEARREDESVSPATKQQIEEIIAELLDDSDSQRAGTRAWYAMRMTNLDLAREVAVMSSEGGEPLLRPMYALDALRIARRWGQTAVASVEANWPAAAAQLPADDTARLLDYSGLDAASHILTLITASKIDSRVREQYHALAERRMAAIALAVRLYRSDHEEKYPASLADLVPEYLPAVPIDPMAAGTRPMKYRADAKPPIVYSVGDNGRDDAGATKPGADRWAGPDAVFPLGFTPEPAPTSQSSESRARRTLPQR